MNKASYRDQVPTEFGGQNSRQGLDFQDHVAAHFCLLMLISGQPTEVWCETLDDITLIWNDDSLGEVFEFVQAKGAKLDQLWSIPKLCERTKVRGSSGRSPSIVEKLLAKDTCCEPCRFRVATAQDFNAELSPLTLPLASPTRQQSDALSKIVGKLRAKIGNCLSRNGNDLEFWTKNAICEVFGKVEYLIQANILKLSEFATAEGLGLTNRQITKLYDLLVRHVFNAGRASWAIDPEDKKLVRAPLIEWIKAEAAELGMPGTKGDKLRAKLAHAKFDEVAIQVALDIRRNYRRRSLSAGYLEMSSRLEIEADAIASLHSLLTALDADDSKPEGPPFLADCQAELRHLAQQIKPRPKGLIAFLYGYMYEVADRCMHRFSRSLP